jgi:hypothetical protein
MLRRTMLRGRILSHLLVTVAVLVFSGHVCVLPHDEPPAVEANQHDHDAPAGAESHQHGSCDASLSQAHVGAPAAPQVVTPVVSVVALDRVVLIDATWRAASKGRTAAHSPPLFLRHSALLI